MSITRGVLAQSPEPEAHDKVLDNNPDRIGIWKCWFLRRGENRSTRRKTSRSKDENQQQTQPTFDAESGNRTRATLVGGKCSTTASSLLPREQIELSHPTGKFPVNVLQLLRWTSFCRPVVGPNVAVVFWQNVSFAHIGYRYER